MWQLNLAMSEEEAIQIVDLYDTSGKGEMRYEQLVKDVCAGVRRGVLPDFERKTTMHHLSWRRPRGDASRCTTTAASRETAAGPALHEAVRRPGDDSEAPEARPGRTFYERKSS